MVEYNATINHSRRHHKNADRCHRERSKLCFEKGTGVCGAIFSATGAEILKKACNKIGYCETGKAVITSGYALASDFIIHTVGPTWRGGDSDERDLLYACYKNLLELAKAYY